jgi:hypothetical protein
LRRKHYYSLVLATAVAMMMVFAAPVANAYEATPWETSPKCPGGVGQGVFINVSGTGVLEVQWRLSNVPTAQTHYSRRGQPPYPHSVYLDSHEPQIAWRAVAFDTFESPGDIAETQVLCGGLPRAAIQGG